MSQPEPPAPLLCLASASPRRSELLTQIGVPHVVIQADIDETAVCGESPLEYVRRLARAKALAIRNAGQTLPVLAADTTVVLDGKIFGKPGERSECLDMLERLSGRWHEVLTAVSLAHPQGMAERSSLSKVQMRALTREECVAYWDSGEPRDKAGGYAIQGLGAVFIQTLQGSYSGVMGLPLFETAQLLREAGIAYWRGFRA